MKTTQGISYQTVIKVYLEGRKVGGIVEEDGGFRYWPVAAQHGKQRFGGDLCLTIEECKASLEGE